ncbi:hypothetical protein NUU61_005534 [Penicillium alfredii]|uniref:Uncharacterized protein n=1 Tax=Penicillium alfredii TaxID=1506179 RepID=A0A9W9K7Q8_9EURO|nr:uncharacterized protein NUU61_005534 [Penicillium alfredii]KAJ5096178.1 hypothetical protein NUU61_005534 [Penicillium alfredii]
MRPHTFTGYWGAVRDRIPGSGWDAFEKSSNEQHKEENGHRTNTHNTIHIRPGQFWANSGAEEGSAYSNTIEPKLRRGLRYLWKHPNENGSMGARYLVNTRNASSSNDSSESNESQPLQEACVTAFFRSNAHLEAWVVKQPFHLAIYAVAIQHAKRFGDGSSGRGLKSRC